MDTEILRLIGANEYNYYLEPIGERPYETLSFYEVENKGLE